MTFYLIIAAVVIAASLGWIVFELLWTYLHGRNLDHARNAPTAPETLLDVDRTGKTCRRHGHVVESPGSLCGWCPRCEHSVTGSGHVLYYGKFYRKAPPHDEEAEARSDAWARDYVNRLMSPNADRAALDRERRAAFGIKERRPL